MSATKYAKLRPAYLFIVPWPLDTLGGVTQVVENLMNQIKRHDDYVPLLMVNSWYDRNIRKQNIKHHAHYFFRLRNIIDSQKPFRNLLAFSLFLPVELYIMWRFLIHHRVAVVNVHYCGLYALNVSILKALRLFRGKFILSFHGSSVFTERQDVGVIKRLWKLLLHSADRIVTCSEALKKEVAGLDERCSRNICVIHNGIDIAFLKEERDRSYHLDQALDGRKIVLNVASFEHRKGQDILVRAFADVAALFPDADLVMIGRPLEPLEGLRHLIRYLDLERRVWLYEGLPHSKMAVFYEAATVFALPSRYEPFGIVILEAGAFGVPVVATSVGGICEILSHDQTGRLCQPDDSENLAKELVYLLEHPDERRRLGNNLRKHVLENFSWERAYRKYVECVRD